MRDGQAILGNSGDHSGGHSGAHHPTVHTEGEEMAATAVAAALTFTDDGNADRTGVTAYDNGYCFGRESVAYH